MVIVRCVCGAGQRVSDGTILTQCIRCGRRIDLRARRKKGKRKLRGLQRR
jgi:hypothetical protein